MASSIFTKKVTPLPGVHLKSRDKSRDAVLAFDKVNTAPTTSGTTNAMLWVDSSGNLTFGYNGSNVIVGAAGSGGQTWDSIFSTDKTLALTTDTWTITQGSNVALLTLNKTASGAGSVIAITNSGTGKDIANGSAWSIVASGGVGVLEIGSAGTINATDGALTIGKTATATTIAGTLTVDEAVTLTGAVTATASLTITGTADTNVLTVTAGDIVVSNGKITLTNDDTDAGLTMTCNSVTGGNAILVTANGVTTGAMLNLVTTDSGFSGNYIKINDGSDVFTVADEGNTTIVGAGGSTMFTISAGDMVMSDGSVAITDADDAASFTVTNDTATTASVLVFAGSGAFTGNTTSSFATLTASGLTTGTVLYVPAAALTTGKVLNIQATAATDGVLATINGGGANMSATGRLAVLTMGAATVGRALEISTTGTYTGAGVVTVTADSATTSGASAGEGIIAISADGLTTGVALRIESASNEALTSGSLARLVHSASGTTVAAITGALLDLTSSVTESGTSTQDFDVASFKRTSIHDTAGTLTAQGSVLKLENVEIGR